jgi:release factor glutamine methyltransferase
MTANATMAALLAEGTQRLRGSVAGAAAGASPALDAELLLAHVLQIPRARLQSHPEAVPDRQRVRQYLRLLERRALGEPLAYLTGWREFWSLRLAVSPAVLVPRPETELLVERALALRVAPEGRVADLGTGCGAIALALASERPRWQVIATDVSAVALEVARANAARLGLEVQFRPGSWFEPLAAERYDLLVSNPPYIGADDPLLSGPLLAHEPRLALTPGADALSCLRAIAREAPRHLAAGGWLLLEHAADQAAQVRRELVAAGLRSVRSHRDLAGHERMTEGQYGQI